MSQSSFVNSDNFLAVALVINRSRDGPAFVFHYPPRVPSGSEAKDAREAADLEDSLLERLSQPASRRNVSGNMTGQWDGDDHDADGSEAHLAAPWEQVAGFPVRDLAGILTPARSYHKSLFQLSLDPLHCVSYPIHVPEDGKWKRQKKKRRHKSEKDMSSVVVDEQSASNEPDVATPDQLEDEPEEQGPEQEDEPAAEEPPKEENDEEKRSSMTMFNLVFILNPGRSGAKDLVDALYTHIVKKANKAYKYSQQHSDFIWKESKRILAAKEKAREEKKKMSTLWKEIIQSSSLAASMQDIYNSVSQNRIAALHLETSAGILTPSFQIPSPFYVSDIPQWTDVDQRGLWLTTSNAFLSQETLEEPGFLDRNFALLLMDEEKKIISELQADPDPTTTSMIEFVRLAKPTLSFHQIAQSNILTLAQVRDFAQHFIYWRRAIAIPPLHARDVYIVSPNCDPRRLPQDSMEWQSLFPVAPPLANFLSELSQAPRPYKHFCPSKAHRPSYLLMLAWLMRRGWVTQLCTFAYVIVWPEILYEVDYEIEAADIAAAEKAAAPTGPPVDEDPDQSLSPKSTAIIPPGNPNPPPSMEASISSIDEAPSTILSTTTTSANGDDNDNDSDATGDDAGSSNNPVEHAAERARLERIANKAQREAAERALAHSRKVVPVATSHPSLNDAPHLKGLSPHIILDAKKATGKEARYLSAISRRYRSDRVSSGWKLFCKYFDGKCALERIALQEDMKRKDVWGLLTAMTEYVLCTRHW